MKYYVIRSHEDGCYIKEYTKEELLKNMEIEEYERCIHYLEGQTNTAYWNHHNYLIIKGTIVIPTPVETVIKYEID